MENRYMVIGGNPFRGYTGTQTYTAIRVIGLCPTIEDARNLWQASYEDCGGLLLIVDCETGKEVS